MIILDFIFYFAYKAQWHPISDENAIYGANLFVSLVLGFFYMYIMDEFLFSFGVSKEFVKSYSFLFICLSYFWGWLFTFKYYVKNRTDVINSVRPIMQKYYIDNWIVCFTCSMGLVMGIAVLIAFRINGII